MPRDVEARISARIDQLAVSLAKLKSPSGARPVDGMWRGRLRGISGPSGVCLLAFCDGMIVGADHSYHFAGDYKVDSAELVAKITLHRYCGTASSGGWRDGMQLELRGQADGRSMLLEQQFIGAVSRCQTLVCLTKLVDWCSAQP